MMSNFEIADKIYKIIISCKTINQLDMCDGIIDRLSLKACNDGDFMCSFASSLFQASYDKRRLITNSFNYNLC